MRRLLLAALVACHAPATPHGPVQRYHAARAYDPASGTWTRDALLTVADGAIVALASGTAADATELGDVTLLPGLVDAHEHVMSDETDGYLAMLKLPEAKRIEDARASAAAILAAGYTTVRDCGNEGLRYQDVTLRDAIARGELPGPHLFLATRMIAKVNGYYPNDVPPGETRLTGAQEIATADEAAAAAREQLAHGADLLKVYADFPPAPGTPPRTTLSVEELRAVVNVAHAARRRVAAHATTRAGIANALDAGVDSIEHGDEADLPLLKRMAASNVALVPTVAVLQLIAAAQPPGPRRESLERRVADKARLLREARTAGVRVATGLDGGSREQHGQNANEAIAFVALGDDPREALRSATIRGAEVIGIEAHTGSLAPGKRADVIAVQGDPVADIHALGKVAFVMKDGRPVSTHPAH